MTDQGPVEQPTDTVVAMVILTAAGGREFDGTTVITRENVAEFMPTPETAAVATESFRAAGFEVGPVVGVGLSIAGPLAAFEEFFRTEIVVDERNGAFAVDERSGRELSRRLPLGSLPDELVPLTRSIEFEEPVEFGAAGSA